MADDNDENNAMLTLLAPDGYYKYLGIDKNGLPSADKSAPENASTNTSVWGSDAPPIDDDQVKKAYRKLSRKHHPDKPGGDADTFRLLNRAQKVLMNPKLRQQYDILGIDLDDDEVHDDNLNSTDEKDQQSSGSSTAQGIVHEIASLVLSSLVQLGVRTRTYMSNNVPVLIVNHCAQFLHFILYAKYSHDGRSGYYCDAISHNIIPCHCLSLLYQLSDITTTALARRFHL
jgi:hypothetical protein